jgi:RHS repeat-associated protein
MSRKNTGFRFAVLTVLLLLVALLSSNPVLADTPFQVIVELSYSESVSGLRVYAFTESGSYTGKNATTDEYGTALFSKEDFEPGVYQFRVDYLGQQFWSGLVDLHEEYSVTVVIEEEAVVVVVTDGVAPMEGIKVYLFSAAGAYLGRYKNTDSNGEVSFHLPLDMDVKFRADYLGYQFWSNDAVVSMGPPVNLDIPHQSVDITIEGVFQTESEPIAGIRVYLFTVAGSYQGQYEETDSNGQVSFSLPETAYKVRADYLGKQFWSDEFTWQDSNVVVPMADAQILVTGNGQPLESIRVYLFSATGSYLGLYDTTDSNGHVLFRLPAGSYKFRADFQGNQYWSGEATLIADQINPVSISTGGGSFVFTVLKNATDPIIDVKCYVFSESGTYLGISDTTNTSGEVSFDLADGRYKIRTDYLGYQFWTNIFEVPNILSDALLIAHEDVAITIQGIYQQTPSPLEGIKVYLFTPSGSYLGQYQVSDENGQVIFNLPEQSYKVRVDLMAQQFWSDGFTWQATIIEVPMADAEITVTSSESQLEGVKVYVFSETGSYLGVFGTTDVDGKTTFRLPTGTYKFRADYKGNQYWSGGETLTADQVNPLEITTGGGNFTFTVLMGGTDPLVGVKCYVFTENGSYLGISGTTDENGQVLFDLATGQFKYRVDYLGYQYWSNVYDVPTTLNDILTIPHQEVIITVEALYGTATPIEGVNVYLFIPSGKYLGQFQMTNVDGQVVLYLPDQPYKVRVDYQGYQFWSDEFQSANTTVTINEGVADIHVHRGGMDIEDVRVYLFSESGSYLGRSETTDALGKAGFQLPDGLFRFRVDEGGSQYWSPVIEITAGVVNNIEIDLSPTTVTFSADPNTIPVGGTSTLMWSSTNAYVCEIQPDIGTIPVNGYMDVSPMETTEYTIAATGPGGVVTDSVQVMVTAEIIVPDDVDFGFAFDEQEGGGGLVGETVRLLNGNMVEVRSDLSFPSPNSLGLDFAATYNSRSTISGALGFGWTHTYSATLDPDFEISGASYLKVLCPKGRDHYFQEETPGNYKGAFHERSHVKEEAGDYVWYRLNGSRYGFSTEGTLLWIEDEKANRISIAYDAQDCVETVSDAASGRVLTFGYNVNGLLESITGPVTPAVSDGIWVTYGYDANQNLTAITYADGSGFTYGYTDPNDVHNLTEKRNKADHLLNTWAYDDQDRCESNFSVKGKGVDIQYISDTRAEVTDAYSTVRTYTLEDVGGRKRVTALQGNAVTPYKSSNAIRWVYDDSMRLIEAEYANGSINQYKSYDDRGNPGIIKLAAGTPEERTITFTYHPDMNVPLARTEASVLQAGENKVTIWDYDDDYDNVPNEDPAINLSRIVEQGYTRDISGATAPYEYVTIIAYNGKGQIVSFDGPLAGAGDLTSITYGSASGDLLTVTRPHIGTTALENYDLAGQVGRITDVNVQSKGFTYDGKGRITSTTNLADGSTESISYNIAGLLDTTTDEDGVPKYCDYDSTYGRLTRITDLDGNYIAYLYDTQGNRIEMGKYDPSANRTSRKRWDYQHPNFPGKLWKEIKANESHMAYGYDSSGNVSAITDYETHTTFYQYDLLNRLRTVTQPASTVTTYEYDRHGNLISVTDAEGHETAYIYDDMCQVVSTTSPDTRTVAYEYDAAGNLLQKTDAMGITVNYDYDLLSRLTGVHFPDSEDIVYTYDEGTYGKGRRTGMTDPTGSTTFSYDNRGRMVGKTATVNGVTYPLSRTYTVGSRLSTITYPRGRSLNYARYLNGKIQGVSTTYNSTTTTLVDNLAYKPFGKPTGLTTGSGGTVNNQSNNCDCLEVANPGEPMEQVYTYDENQNLTSIRGTNTPWFNQDFSYDALNRLTSATGSYGTIGYTYDRVGNRMTRAIEGQTDTYTYITGTNKLQEITGPNPATYTHDANGNITGIGGKTLVYNQNNRLQRVEEGGTVLGEYAYNGLGQRITKTVGGNTTVFHYDFDGNIIGESESDGTFTTEYLYLGASRTAKIDMASGNMYYYHNNYLGTPLLMTDDTGTVVWEADYKPFGEATVNPNSTVVNNFRFPGQYYDTETGFHYNYHRYYDPKTGRYLTPDPLGLSGGFNPYAYVKNNPVNRIDPTGLFCGCEADCPSGSYTFTGVEYGGFLFFGGVTTKHLFFRCMGGEDMFHLKIQSVSFGGGLGGGVQMPTGIVAGCDREDVISNISGWGIFTNVFPPGIPNKPGFGVGGEVGTDRVVGNAPYPIPSAVISPGYGLEVSAGGSYSWIVE